MRIRCSPILAVLVIGCAESPDPAAYDEWQPTLDLTIGSESDDRYVFHRIAGVALDQLGRIYVADAGEGRVRVYSDAGHHIRDIGTPGDGPGEFRNLHRIGFLSDTLYAIHGRAQRVAYFDSAGTFLQSIPVERVIDRPGTIGDILQNGRMIVIGSAPAGAGEPAARMVASLVGGRIDTLDYLPAGEGTLALRAGSGTVYMRDPFAQPRFLPVHRSGEWWIDVSQYPDRPHRPGEFSLTRRTLAGDTIWSKTMLHEPVAFPSSHAAGAADSILTRTGLPIPAGQLREALRPPTHYHAVDRVMVADNGDIWLRVRRNDGNSWVILDSGGDPVGRLALPGHAVPGVVIGRDAILAVLTNELGVETVVRFRLRR